MDIVVGITHHKDAPRWASDFLAQYGGRSTLTGQPRYRMIWSEDAKRKYPRFWQRERWIIERLLEPSDVVFVPGVHGEYHYCDILDDQGTPIEPTRTYLAAVIDRIGVLTGQSLADYLEANERVEEERYRHTYNRVLDELKDANRPFEHRPRAWLTGLAIPN